MNNRISSNQVMSDQAITAHTSPTSASRRRPARAIAPLMTASLLAPLLATLSGCTVGPDYREPDSTISESARSSWGTSAAAASGPDITSTTADHEPPDFAWWQTFNDPALTMLIEKAAAANLDVRIAAARVREARALRGSAAAELLPRVDAQGTATALNRSVDGPLNPGNSPDRRGELYQLGFDASWELDIFGGSRRAVEAADADLAAVIDDRRAVLVSVLGETTRTYVELKRARERAAISRRTIAVQADTLDLVRALRAAGRSTDVDEQRAITRLATTRATLPQLEFEASRAAYRLAVLLGAEPTALLETLGLDNTSTADAATPAAQMQSSAQAIIQLAPPPRVPIGLPSEMLRRRADVRSAERALAAATARIGVATADLFPKFFLTGSAGIQSADFANALDAARGFWSLGPSFSWPVFEFGRLRARVAAQDARTQAAAAEYEQAVLLALEETHVALVGFGKEQQRLAQLSAAVESASQAAEQSRSRYQAGLETFQIVLDAEAERLTAEETAADSRAELASRLVQLYKSLGGGWQPFEPADNNAAPAGALHF